MIRSLILRTSAALASAAMVLGFAASPVHAGNITLSDSNCDSFALSGTAPNQTLSCIVSNAPSGCTISGPTSGTINIPITLTATCATGSPNAWSWTGGNCAGQTTQSCAANSASVGQVTYTVTPRNNIGAGNTPSSTVTWSNTPPAAPTGCTLGASATSLPVGGGPVTLTASCATGAPTSYAWTGNNLPTPTTNPVASTSITATTTFTVTPSNSGGNGNTASVTVTVAGSVLGLCGPPNNFTVLPMLDATWGQQASWQSNAGGNFGDNTVWLFRLVVPPGTPISSIIGTFTAAENQGPNTFRQLTISTQACDFRQKDYTGVNGPLAMSNGTTVSISYGVATPFIFGPAGLSAGQTYYISVRNWQLDPTPQSSCGQTSCNAVMNDTPAKP
jgi:hypothetical protein